MEYAGYWLTAIAAAYTLKFLFVITRFSAVIKTININRNICCECCLVFSQPDELKYHCLSSSLLYFRQ